MLRLQERINPLPHPRRGYLLSLVTLIMLLYLAVKIYNIEHLMGLFGGRNNGLAR